MADYVTAGALPPPVIQGRNAAWLVDDLAEFLADDAKGRALPAAARALLMEHLDELGGAGAAGSRNVAPPGKSIAAGHLVDDEANPDLDWRPAIFERNAEKRAAAREFHRDALNQPRGSDKSRSLFDSAQRNRDAVELNEARLASEFLPAHSSTQLLAARDLTNHPVFTARTKQNPREHEREVAFKLADGTTMKYSGPELRQDDALMLSALLRIAIDARPGRMVAFSPADLCLQLYNDYCGRTRKLLKETIGRLQLAKLTFATFSVQLVGRFEFPQRGLWSVALDSDVVRLFTDGRDVRLKLDKALHYGDGLAGWLYRYICSQTTLIPTSVSRLHMLSGSSSPLERFRRTLKRTVLPQLVAGGEIHKDYSLDKRDVLRWKKLRPEASLAEPQAIRDEGT